MNAARLRMQSIQNLVLIHNDKLILSKWLIINKIHPIMPPNSKMNIKYNINLTFLLSFFCIETLNTLFVYIFKEHKTNYFIYPQEIYVDTRERLLRLQLICRTQIKIQQSFHIRVGNS